MKLSVKYSAEYSFEPMAIEDYDEIYALWDGVPGLGLSSADSREGIAAYLAHNPGQSFVCKASGRIAGAILCGSDGRRAYIHHTVVAPEHQRKGLASELVRLATAAQKELGLQKCHLFLIVDNESGEAFWRAMGFEKRRDIGVMSKNL